MGSEPEPSSESSPEPPAAGAPEVDTEAEHEPDPEPEPALDPQPEPDPQPELAIVDIDGVVADVRHRLHHVEAQPRDWDAFFGAAHRDPLHEEGAALVRRLAQDHEVVFLTGRPEWLRADTAEWLERHGMGGHLLLMRRRGDRRPAKAMKLQVVRDLARGRTIGAVVDDDQMVVDTMRRAGYPTLLADWEARSIAEEQALLDAQESDGQT
jgi:hypothetical protein